MSGVARVIAGVTVVFAVAYQMAASQAPPDAPQSSSRLSDPDRTADALAKAHPEPGIPGPHACVARQHRWITPVQGYVLDWCAIELHTDGRGNAAVTAYVDSPIQRGFMETAHRTVRYDFDCAGHYSIDLSPPLSLISGPLNLAQMLGNAVCSRAAEMLNERSQNGR